MNFYRICIIAFPALLSLFLLCLHVFALTPDEVLVIANRNAAKSKGLAAYYMEKRNIPQKNLVLVFITDKETCTYNSYATKVIPPVRRAVEADPDLRAIVTLYGMPLRIINPEFSAGEKIEFEKIKKKIKSLEAELKNNDSQSSEQKQQKKAQLKNERTKLKIFNRAKDKTAALDSELMLVKLENYDLNSWLPNPYFIGFEKDNLPLQKSDILMTSRLDGADAQIVKRIIDDSIEAEQKGLTGSACFDARWKDPGQKKVKDYQLYDRSIHRAAQIISKTTQMKVFINDGPSLFIKGECPDAALYCGWYSLARYIDAFTWQKGSVGFHIASSECTTLKNQNSRVWCKKMLDNGIAATIGPVGEPYVQAFPMPEIFFGFLTDGYLSLAESYLVSLPYLSWKMVLIGDPLYKLKIKGQPDGT